ncbi:MAG TPA: hypothetical protein VF088_02850 [Pyrinomonadaceae bacterium]
MDSNYLLVPIKVQALVIDDLVINKSGAIKSGDKYAANTGRWSPLTYDYQQVPRALTPPGPVPFYGAGHQYSGTAAEELVLPKDSPALPKDEHRGVYLHWILPAGLRHAYTPGQFDFPALPDHWLIVRFSHPGAAVKTRAWFVDGGAAVSEGQGNLLFESGNKYTAKTVGKVTPLEQFATPDFSREPQKITALGNATTGSPTFTAFIAENRNIFSWHDKLEDLRDPITTGSVPDGTTLTYLLLGWYRTPAHEPLSAPAVTVTAQHEKDQLRGWLIDPPGWFVDAKSDPVALLKRRSVFHGMIAHINYWANTYQGEMLGYPGSPSVEGVMRPTQTTFTVGVGNNAEDALVSLVSSSYSAESAGSILAEKQPNLWKALEAVIYRQTESLVKNWNIASRDITVHENWFNTRDAGKTWYFRPKSGNETQFSQDAEETARETKVRPTDAQLAKLSELNRVQSEADALSREMSALQADLYARWWKLCAKSRNRFSDRPTAADEADLEELTQQITNLRGRLAERVTQLSSLPETLKNSLPSELELKSDAAPRFWVPADPVIVVKDCGLPTKHQFPRQHPCRLPEQIVTTGEVIVTKKDTTKETKTFDTAAGVANIAAAATKHLPACPEVVPALLDEGSIIEQAIHDLATRSLPAKLFDDQGEWRKWTQRLEHDLTWDGDLGKFPLDEVKFGKPNALNIRAHRLADPWIEQPWSPLFLDWEITWFPTSSSSTPEHSFGPAWVGGQADFTPLNAASIPTKGFTIRGRSLLSPIDERIFKEPINALRDLLREDDNSKGDNSFSRADAREVLKRYEIVWDKTLKALSSAGLLGQALSGFHQSLLRRDVIRPRVMPDPKHPWIGDRIATEEKVSKALEPPNQPGVAGEQLVPPRVEKTGIDNTFFSLIRAGALRIDELWLIDDFGQTADLLGKKGGRQVFHPRMRWHNDEFMLAMPPRVLQPVRLNFRFAAEAEANNPRKCDPSLDPICGWLFFNPLDRALVLCDRCGELMGHLVISKDATGRRVAWNGGDPGAGGVALDKIPNDSLKAFAKSFIQTTPVSNPKLVELLNLIDRSLPRIRPAAARNNTILVGRPLALVNATVGLELFGKAWTDPHTDFVKQKGTGSALDALSVRVNLGDLHNVEDGLIGYFKGGAFDRLVVHQFPDKIAASDYLGDPKKYAVQVGFGPPERITLLMDPWGSVQAACGIVPAKTISMADGELDETVTQMETSFRVGPVLVQPDRIALPTPTGDKGVWNFSGPMTNQTATVVAAFDPRHFNDQPVVATEGRLLLLNEE